MDRCVVVSIKARWRDKTRSVATKKFQWQVEQAASIVSSRVDRGQPKS